MSVQITLTNQVTKVSGNIGAQTYTRNQLVSHVVPVTQTVRPRNMARSPCAAHAGDDCVMKGILRPIAFVAFATS